MEHNNLKRKREEFEQSNNEINFNLLAFKEILVYLSYDCSFNRLLELSLISKQSFTTIKYLITHQQNLIKFYPEIKVLNKYINNDNNSNINNNKLIDFKEMEELKLKTKKGSYNNKEFNKLKSNLIEKCGKNLKKVQIIDYINYDPYYENPTEDGFYQFNKLNLDWNRDEGPNSYESEFDEDDDDAEIDSFEFSFEFLSRYPNIKKLSMTTMTSDMDLHIYKLAGILKNSSKTLETINFQFHNTAPSFVIQALESRSPVIKSLSVRLGTFLYKLYGETTKENNKIKDTSKMVSQLFKKANISANTTLMKLKLRKNVDTHKSPNNKDPSEFLSNLIGNTKLKKLGLELFELNGADDYKLLSPLIQIPNISSLYCNPESIESFLQHCNENENIKTLTIFKDFNSKFKMDTQKEKTLLSCFSNFFNQNRSLHNLVVVHNELFSNDQLLLDVLNSSKNNNNLIIKFKKINKNLIM
ncbi:hypothetical protein DICPUDRAFT_98986 [Dictyostelium purpureum]|uniref:Uncharacterized protein n=1 Tax=Dictyostelium purpureum TaxID=5786 RepID=F0ZVC7_DICPU|nr:uncharacterized protein DICPUDRAFT_98986 [Dictyostelium purpureum]EGC32121.1 hypothetical protein DICPUDRAFT_98986 [Dictyostelium purpureum]|eukprot:XP_003291371.1 hypothetical protein DICPUDRAFT_98986 [Dictyostelium purpureum]